MNSVLASVCECVSVCVRACVRLHPIVPLVSLAEVCIPPEGSHAKCYCKGSGSAECCL